MDVGGFTPWGIYGKKNYGLFQKLRQGVHDATLKEKKLSRAEIGLRASVAHPEGSAPGKDVEIFVALQMIMRRGGLIDAKNPGAGNVPVDEIMIEQHRGGGGWKRGGDGGDVEAAHGRRIAFFSIHNS